jgi:hypothetical protein
MGRGPSYPFIDLEEAIAATRKIYEYTKRAAAPTDAVVEHALGYSLKSSGGVKTIAALKAFGLIEENAQSMKITDRAYRILIDLAESPERKQAIKDAALSPKWYQTAFEKWGPDPPASTRSTLIMQHGFIPTTVDSFLKGYRQTIAYAGLTGGQGVIKIKSTESSGKESYSTKVGDYVQWESQGALRMPAARKLTHFSPNGDFAFVEGSPTGIPIAELIPGEPPQVGEEIAPPNIFIPALLNTAGQGGSKMQTETFALPEGVTGQLQWPSQMSAEAYADFVYQLEGLKMRVNRAVKKDAVPKTDVPSENEG